MAIAALKLLGILLGLGLAIGLVVIVVWLIIAQMAWLGVLQWRDLVSLDRWQEVLVTIGRNKLRTALTTISVAWGIFVLVFLLGLGRGLDAGMRHEFARDATNGVWIFGNKTSVAHDGYEINRRITFDNRDYDTAKKIGEIDHISGQLRGTCHHQQPHDHLLPACLRRSRRSDREPEPVCSVDHGASGCYVVDDSGSVSGDDPIWGLHVSGRYAYCR